eukprot:scaffold9076_cov68-Phaeocystis_antarctica.AAC.7
MPCWLAAQLSRLRVATLRGPRRQGPGPGHPQSRLTHRPPPRVSPHASDRAVAAIELGPLLHALHPHRRPVQLSGPRRVHDQLESLGALAVQIKARAARRAHRRIWLGARRKQCDDHFGGRAHAARNDQWEQRADLEEEIVKLALIARRSVPNDSIVVCGDVRVDASRKQQLHRG